MLNRYSKSLMNASQVGPERGDRRMRSGTTVSREHVFDRCGNCEILGFALLVTQTGNARATIEVMATPQVLILQHVPWERPGRILSNLEDIGLETVTMNIVDKKKPDLPDFGELAGVVIMGGPMGALDYDKYPGLKASRFSVYAWGIRLSPLRLVRSCARAMRRRLGSRRSSVWTSMTSSPCGISS